MYNEKPTKNIITKESIASDMQTKDKGSILPIIALTLVYILCVGAVFCAIYFLVIKAYDIQMVGQVIFFA